MDRLDRNFPGWLVYGALLLGWLLIVGWLSLEHARVSRMERQALLTRARDISNTIALVTRTGVPGVIFQSRLEDALRELIETTELESAALLNAAGEIVVEAGPRPREPLDQLPARAVRWQRDSVLVVNLVDFGRRMEDDGTTLPATIVLPRREDRPTTRGRGLADDRPGTDSGRGGFRGRFRDRGRVADDQMGPPFLPPPFTPDRAWRPGPSPPEGARDFFRRGAVRPPWMSEERYQELRAKRGLHGFVLQLSTQEVKGQLKRDAWLRASMGLVALLAVVGAGFAWRGFVRSTRLRMRLLRAQEMNAHLREMNLAAAGLAHETRNPLNIVRGLAQMIERRQDLPPSVATQTRQIMEEVDQVTYRLNEFIKFSRPAEPRMGIVPLAPLLKSVVENLRHDLEEKAAAVDVNGGPIAISADEALLRQAVFNLLLNAIQAVNGGGRIRIRTEPASRDSVSLLIDDNGPGIPADQREMVFRPYYTTRTDGAGLGLSVVRQIVLAHRWEVSVSQSDLGGASFRISGLRVMRATPDNGA